ncbi:hypothetical protein DFQ28_002103 [Apophysomyces sp. BC1034]|nr:hypothetical protein DFQ30_010333 [Apophysomyces sp. BC1015]KAG0181275.1 hypothetical protein DFQ29_008802 [Apophysomyces sp. BC1021]KAG0193994.1 hypothetical protein DFQ28_002103 [Apophysomyces sp. BC1034]
MVHGSFSMLFRQLTEPGKPSDEGSTGFKPSNEAQTVMIGDFGGSDFKRLAQKSRISRGVIENTRPEPRTYTETRPSASSPQPQHCNNHATKGLASVLYDLLISHEDSYFKSDRTELSKDIFPAAAWSSTPQHRRIIRSES